MKKLASILLMAAATVAMPLLAENLVILHSNDTHSLIFPDKKGAG